MIRLYPGQPESAVVEKVRRVSREIASKHAVDVDAQARFPKETFDALRAEKALSAAVPAELGGDGAGIQELSAQCMELSKGCAASGMVLAMHHIQVACIARHGMKSECFRGYLQEVVRRQRLIASVTSEVGVWGDTRSSICALEQDGGRRKLSKKATTISYGREADDLLVTCRRHPDSPASDQILVLMKEGDYQLEQTTTWDTMGMRGTCSPGFDLEGVLPAEQVLPGSFADASAQTMVTYSHIIWAAVWLGIAADAISRASAYVRKAARKSPGQVPHQATRLAEASVQLQEMRNNVAAQAAEFDDIMRLDDGMERLMTIGWALKMNNLKVGASNAAPQIVHQALRIVGIGGYKNDGPFAMGRHYRDVLSAALMINNDRIFEKTASMLLVYKDE